MQTKIPQRRKLKNGLFIVMTSHPGGVTLKLSRDNTYPSEQEWKTTLNNFPYFTGTVLPAKTIDNDRRPALVGEIPRRQAVQLPLAPNDASDEADRD